MSVSIGSGMLTWPISNKQWLLAS